MVWAMEILTTISKSVAITPVGNFVKAKKSLVFWRDLRHLIDSPQFFDIIDIMKEIIRALYQGTPVTRKSKRSKCNDYQT